MVDPGEPLGASPRENRILGESAACPVSAVGIRNGTANFKMVC